MNVIKIIILFAVFNFSINFSQASTLFTPSDDVNYTDSGLAINSVGGLSSYNFLNNTIFSIPYLKFNINNIKDDTLSNLTLRLKVGSIYGSGTPDLNLYFINNDNWKEGDFYLCQGTASVNLQDYAAFTSINRPEMVEQNFITKGILNNEWYEWQFSYNNLSDDIKLGIKDGTISFAILNLNGMVNFDQQEIRGNTIETIYEEGQNIFARVEALPNPNAPQLIVDTIPTPEPSTMLIGFLGMVALAKIRKK
jgi:hypothetical protein